MQEVEQGPVPKRPMDSGDSRNSGRFHPSRLSFGKSHSASSLRMISNAAPPREDNEMGGFQQQGQRLQKTGPSYSPSSPSSGVSSLTPSPANRQGAISNASPMKTSFINVFSLKNRTGVEANTGADMRVARNEENASFRDPLQFSPEQPMLPAMVSPSATPKEASNPNIFKKIISRKALIPRMKAFKRIANDMQMESYPLDDEMQHELIITTAMKEDDELADSSSSYSFLLSRKNNPRNMLNQDNLKKFEIINKANESWSHNRRKSSSSLTNSESYRSNSRRGSMSNVSINLHKRKASVTSLIPLSTSTATANTLIPKDKSDMATMHHDSSNWNGNESSLSKHDPPTPCGHSLLSNPFENIRKSRKRKAGGYDDCYTDVEEYLSDEGSVSPWNPMMNCKRRLVSGSVTNSPKSPALDPCPSRRNSIMMQSLQSTSDDFEQMSLK